MDYSDVRVANEKQQMPQVFPTLHSVLDNEAVGQACAQQYGLHKQPYCELFHRGMNDVYRLRVAGKQYAVRAWRANWRSMDDVAYELEFLEFLKNHRLPVAPGIRTVSGASYFVVQAPEGARALAAFEWVPGVKFSDRIDIGLAVRLDQILADIHQAGEAFLPSKPRRTNAPSLMAENLPYLERLVSDRPSDLRFYRELAPRLIAALEQIDPKSVPMGACHGDFHLNNGIISDAGEITFLDFDNSGCDYYAADVMGFYWASEFTGHGQAFAEGFLEGYESRRKLAAVEREQLPLFILAKEFRLLTGYARHINALGYYLTRFRDLDWFSASLRKHARDAGFF